MAAKFSKSFTTYFYPVGPEVLQIVEDWVGFLRQQKLCGNDDPPFPASRAGLGVTRHFEATGIDRKAWSTASPIRAVFKQAFEAAGLPYFNPHSFRRTLAQFAEAMCKTPEQFKAWSQNQDHEGVLTTFYSYGRVADRRQCGSIKGLAQSPTYRRRTCRTCRGTCEGDATGWIGGWPGPDWPTVWPTIWPFAVKASDRPCPLISSP